MNQEQMGERCPGSTLVGTAVLNDYRLAFTAFSPLRKCGCADIIPEKGSSVYGLLYTLTEDDLARLDEFEGHPTDYHRIEVTVQMGEERLKVYTYEVVAKEEGLIPSGHYLGLLLHAAQEHQFPQEYQEMLNGVQIDSSC